MGIQGKRYMDKTIGRPYIKEGKNRMIRVRRGRVNRGSMEGKKEGKINGLRIRKDEKRRKKLKNGGRGEREKKRRVYMNNKISFYWYTYTTLHILE